MIRHKGLITLSLAILLGLITAKAVYDYLQASKAARSVVKTQPAAPSQPKPVRPPTFAESIPKGMRAVSLRVDQVSGVSRELQKGDLVDVLATTSISAENPEGGMTRVVLEAVEVLRGPPQHVETGRFKDRIDDWTVSLLVTPEQGAALAAAMKTASISLLIRGSQSAAEPASPPTAFVNAEGLTPVAPISRSYSEKIPPGMRVVSVPVEDTDGLCGLLRYGDRVDVILTCKISFFQTGKDELPGTEGVVTMYQQRSRIILQDVEVLGSERSVHTGVDTNAPVTRVALLTRPEESEKLAAALDVTEDAKIRLTLRNRHDDQNVVTKGQILAELLTQKKVQAAVDIYSGTELEKTVLYVHQ